MKKLVWSAPLCLGAVFATVALAACGPEFSVIPQGGAPHVTAQAANVYMSAFADQWEGEPHDLANWVTPIAVDLYNGTGTEIRVSLADFALRTESGIRIPALNPFTQPLASAEPDREGDGAALQAGPLLAGPLLGPVGLVFASRGGGGGHGGGGRGGGMHFSGGGHRSGSVGPPPGRSWSGGWHGGTGGGPRWGRGFYVAGGLRGYYGPGALYWSGPWGYGIGYGAHVSAWGSGGGYADAPSGDTLDLALPEGVLAPGAHVNGFLYFRKATAPDVRTLLLAWTPVDARSNAPVGEARIVLDVVHH